MFPRNPILSAVATLFLIAALFSVATASSANRHDDDGDADDGSGNSSIQLGPRPFFLVNDMEPSALKTRLKHCDNGPFRKSDFSIGHRGAGLQFPEHTKESYQAAARMGAGIVECDVTFTRDKELVCRHSQCDLHTTTNILDTQLAGKCSKPLYPRSV
jgi:glycerophosphoryl diester phosphodiesterase